MNKVPAFVFGTRNNPTVSSRTLYLLFTHRIDKFSCALLHTSVASSAITENHGGLFAWIFSKTVRNKFRTFPWRARYCTGLN